MKKIHQRPVLIEFWDHAMCSGENAAPCRCQALGFLHREDALCYHVVSWIADQTVDANTEQFAILKSTVIKITYLKEGRKSRGQAYQSR